jgi:hypothetical protein
MVKALALETARATRVARANFIATGVNTGKLCVDTAWWKITTWSRYPLYIPQSQSVTPLLQDPCHYSNIAGTFRRTIQFFSANKPAIGSILRTEFSSLWPCRDQCNTASHWTILHIHIRYNGEVTQVSTRSGTFARRVSGT